MLINPAVQDPMDFPLVRVIQLDWWWWVYGSVGILTRASDRPSQNTCDDTFSIMGKGPKKQWSNFSEGQVVQMFCESSQTMSPTLNGGIGRSHDVEWTSYCLRVHETWSQRYRCNFLR